MTPSAPVVDPRLAREIYLEWLARRPGFVPAIDFTGGSAGALLGAAFARYLETVIRRLNQAPHKHKLAFLESVGIGLQPAQSARAPLVFRLAGQAAGGSAAAGTPVSAPPAPGTSLPIQFETERSVGLTAGKITQIVSLHPGR
ncbi:MAG: putative baseplate assembly protein, partial [Bryobacteraceae bacterium]